MGNHSTSNDLEIDLDQRKNVCAPSGTSSPRKFSGRNFSEGAPDNSPDPSLVACRITCCLLAVLPLMGGWSRTLPAPSKPLSFVVTTTKPRFYCETEVLV